MFRPAATLGAEAATKASMVGGVDERILVPEAIRPLRSRGVCAVKYGFGNGRYCFNLEFISHHKQRYDSVGDYQELETGNWYFSISRMRPLKYCWLVFLHEIIEWGICRLTGVKMKAIDKFDMGYEKARAAGDAKTPCGCKWRSEPGDDIHAPYFNAHQTATLCEKAIAREIGVEWKAYDAAVENLG